MTAEWISIGLLALLVLVFVLDVVGNRPPSRRPKAVPQKKPEPQPGATPQTGPAPEAEAPVAEAEPEAAAPEPQPAPEQEPPQVSVFERVRKGLGKTRANLTGGFSDLFSLGKKIDADLLEEIETTLLMADVGVTATTEIINPSPIKWSATSSRMAMPCARHCGINCMTCWRM